MSSPRQLLVNGPFCLLHLSYGMLSQDLLGNRFQLTLLRESWRLIFLKKHFVPQLAKKVVSDSPELLDFAVGLVNSVLNLPDKQVNFFGENSNYRGNVINPAHQIFGGLVEMTFGLVHASYSLPEWQAVKLTSFAPCTT